MANKSNIEMGKYQEAMEKHSYKIVLASDEDFPIIPHGIKQNEQPRLFAYKGDITLLSNIQNNS